MNYFPILIDLKKFSVVVIGGGEVATRKVKNLLEFDCFPVIIAPQVTIELEQIITEKKLTYIQRKYQKGDLHGFNLIFVATDDPQVDNEIVQEAQNNCYIINFADQPELCNFIVPSYIQRGDLIISISTQGKIPFLSKYIRECLENKFPPEFSQFVALAEILRNKLKKMQIKGETKLKIIDEFLSIKWTKIVEDEDFDYALTLLNDLIDHYGKRK